MKNHFKTNKNRAPFDERMAGNSEVAIRHQNPPGSQPGPLNHITTIFLRNGAWCWEVTHCTTKRRLGGSEGYATKVKANESAKRFVKLLEVSE